MFRSKKEKRFEMIYILAVMRIKKPGDDETNRKPNSAKAEDSLTEDRVFSLFDVRR